MTEYQFHVVDYVVFALMLTMSMGIGVYFAICGGRQKTTKEYFVGDRKIHIIPVTLSLIVSYVSSILIIGMPAEAYMFGGMYLLMTVGQFIGAFLAAIGFVPLFYPLKLTSMNKYLEMRFNSSYPMLMGTISNIALAIMYTGLVLFAPATTISAVTSLPGWSVIFISGTVTIFYTTLGGMKAVIWTDAFQAVVMFGGICAITIQGVVKVGSLSEAYQLNLEGGRLNMLNFNLDVSKRLTFWTMTLVAGFNYMFVMGATQISIQRYSSLSSMRKAKISLYFTMFGQKLLAAMSILSGLAIYAYYAKKGCDPVASGQINNPNQLVTRFVMETLNYPGFPGLFVSALCAGSLSSASSVLNSASANTWEDFIQPRLKTLTDFKATLICKCLVVFYGCVAMILAFLVSTLQGTIMQVSATLNGTIFIILAGLVFCGTMFPWINTKGACIGSLVGFCFILWIAVGSSTVENQLKHELLPTVTSKCWMYDNSSYLDEVDVFNTTSNIWQNLTILEESQNITKSIPESTGQRSGVELLYMVNFYWYLLIGLVIAVVAASVISFITGYTVPSTVDARLVIPCLRRFCMKPIDDEDAIKTPTVNKFAHEEDDLHLEGLLNSKTSTV